MRMKNKYKKPTTFNCYAGSRYRLFLVVCCFVGCLVMFHFLFLNQSRQGQHGVMQIHSEHPYYRELVEVEDDNIKIPPPRKRSPRAMKRKPKRPTTLIEEFLDESSQLRYIFFPGQRTVIDPIKDTDNESLYYHPGRIWLDTEGNPIQAHGGGILYDDRSRTYYWYGEYKDGPTYHAHKKAAARVSILILIIEILGFCII